MDKDQMAVADRFKARYKSGDTPWDVGEPDFNLIEITRRHVIERGKALDVGCGTGDNSIWLARNQFQTAGVDVSDIAIEKAREKAASAGVECEFICADFMKDGMGSKGFAFLFDRGCFHAFRSGEQRRRFASRVADHLEKDGLWLTLTGNADENRQEPGPPQLTAEEIVRAPEPYFEIISLESSHFESRRPYSPRAWRCLMRKRRLEMSDEKPESGQGNQA